MKQRKFLPSLLNAPGYTKEGFGANRCKPTALLEPLLCQHHVPIPEQQIPHLCFAWEFKCGVTFIFVTYYNEDWTKAF